MQRRLRTNRGQVRQQDPANTGTAACSCRTRCFVRKSSIPSNTSARMAQYMPDRQSQMLRPLNSFTTLPTRMDGLRPRAIAVAQVLEDLPGIVRLADRDERGLVAGV